MPLRALGWDPSSAFTLARKTLQNSNTDLWTLNAACWTLAIYPGGDPALAARSISKAALASRNPAIIDTYAWSLYRSGQVEDAKLQEMRALGEAQAENDSLVSYLRACLLGMRGDPVRAEMDLRTIFRQDVSFVDAWTVAERFGERPRASVTVAD